MPFNPDPSQFGTSAPVKSSGPKLTAASVSSGGRSFGVKTPTDNVAKLNNRWNTQYIPQLKQAGVYNSDMAKQVYAYDLQRVKAHKAELSPQEFVNAYHTLHHGQALTAKTGGGSGVGHFLSSAVADVGGLVSALNPFRAIPAMIQESAATFDAVMNAGRTVNQVHSLEDVLGLPGIRDIPGAYTASNLITGNFAQMANHPVSTVLDVLPVASKISEFAAAERLAMFKEVMPEKVLQANEALKNVNSIRQQIGQLKAENRKYAFGLQGDLNKAIKKYNDNLIDLPLEFKPNKAGVVKRVAAPVGSPLEAAMRGRPLTALARETGVSKAISLASRTIGYDKANRVAASMYALKMRGEALLLKPTQDAFKEWQAKHTEIHDYLQYNKKELKGKYANPETKAKLETMQEEERQLAGRFQSALRKEWITQVGRIYGKVVGPEFGFKYITTKDGDKVLVDKAGVELNPRNIGHAKDLRGRYSTLHEFARDWGVSDFDMKNLATAIFGGEDAAEAGSMVLIPHYLSKNLKLLNTSEQGQMFREFNKLTNIFRYSVVMRPQHFIHILSARVLMTLLENPSAFTVKNMRTAWDDAKNGKFSQGVEKFSEFTSPQAQLEHAISQASGKTLARWWKAAAAPAHDFRFMEEFTNNFFNDLNFLAGDARGIKPQDLARLSATYKEWGITMSEKHLAGIESLRRTSMSLDTMTPIERTVIRNVIPFYAYQRMLLQFLTRFPADHPFRAAFLASIGRRENEDWATGLPQKFLDYFPLGSMDKNGNLQFIDTKNANPFRSLNGFNPFTVQGFYSELNPAIQVIPSIAGLNPVTATPELYPDTTIDLRTGNIISTRSQQTWLSPDILGKAVTTFLPPTDAIDAVFNFSGNYSNLKGDSKKRAFLAAVGVPFLPALGGVLPAPLNVPQQKLALAQKEFTEAQKKSTNALASGDLSGDEYAMYPVRGTYMKGADLQALLNKLKAIRAAQGSNDKLTQYLGNLQSGG
jgi:hypothetical protein